MKIWNGLFIALIICSSSCHYGNNRTCAPNYLGIFKINMEELIDSSEKQYIINKGWDKVLLISETSGKPYEGRYYYKTNDSLLKTTEGTWYVTGGYENMCYGTIYQNNLKDGISVNAFSISIKIAPDTYIGLPFRKIKN